MNSISRRLVLPFVGFVIMGSLGLVWWRSADELRQSRDQFAATARTNAEFIQRQNLPPSERTARALGDVLGIRVEFAELGQAPVIGPTDEVWMAELPTKAPGEVVAWGREAEIVALPVSKGWAMYFVRTPPSRFGFLTQPRSFAILGIFWVLSLGLAWLLARGIVLPLRRFVGRLPKIGEASAEPLPEAARRDEIGELARAYAETRAQLAEERGAREQAERLATLGKMATGMAHEINNPVAAIKLHAQLLEGDLPAAAEERVGIILSEAAKIESLVSQWMFLARPQPPQTSSCDLAMLLEQCVRALEPAAAYAGVKIRNQVRPAWMILADQRRLGQAVTNIIANAIHALAGKGGWLEIRVHPWAESALHVVFTDDGPGFTPAALERATELFYSEKEGGMGIGLSVTSEILRAHGGRLILANAPGGGAQVTMEVPTERESARRAESSAPAIPPASTRENTLFHHV